MRRMETRTSVIAERLKDIDRIVAVTSGKGGVGKSLVAATLAAALASAGNHVGLLDLDLQGPSSHIILGVKSLDFPEEKQGILPPLVNGIKFMSLVYFSKDKPGAFRGIDVTNIMIELLAITQWGHLNTLVIDMPPGIGDETLDVLAYIPQANFLVVGIASKVAFGGIEKLVNILIEGKVSVLGVIENMRRDGAKKASNLSSLNIPFLGALRFDPSIEDAIGKPGALLSTPFGSDIESLRKEIEKRI